MPTEQQIANRAGWISALRSGEYKQGATRLENRFGHFCCLGVAAVIDPAVERVNPDNFEEPRYRFRENGPALLATPDRNWFLHRFGVRDPRMVIDACVELNDDYGRSFETIAGWLERAFKAQDEGKLFLPD